MGPVIYLETSLDWVTVEGKLNDNFGRDRKAKTLRTRRDSERVAFQRKARSQTLLTIRERQKERRARVCVAVSRCNARLITRLFALSAGKPAD